jgi:hypothetical protein
MGGSGIDYSWGGIAKNGLGSTRVVERALVARWYYASI